MINVNYREYLLLGMQYCIYYSLYLWKCLCTQNSCYFFLRCVIWLMNFAVIVMLWVRKTLIPLTWWGVGGMEGEYIFATVIIWTVSCLSNICKKLLVSWVKTSALTVLIWGSLKLYLVLRGRKGVGHFSFGGGNALKALRSGRAEIPLCGGVLRWPLCPSAAVAWPCSCKQHMYFTPFTAVLFFKLLRHLLSWNSSS